MKLRPTSKQCVLSLLQDKKKKKIGRHVPKIAALLRERVRFFYRALKGRPSMTRAVLATRFQAESALRTLGNAKIGISNECIVTDTVNMHNLIIGPTSSTSAL